jgi:hypothetical protein
MPEDAPDELVADLAKDRALLRHGHLFECPFEPINPSPRLFGIEPLLRRGLGMVRVRIVLREVEMPH